MKYAVLVIALIFNCETSSGAETKAYSTEELRALQKQCENNDGKACSYIGRDYSKKENWVESAKYYQKACELENWGSCSGLGTHYSHGKGVKKDSKKAHALFQQACDGGDVYGCFNLAGTYFDGAGVKKDVPKALELFQKVCEVNTVGCV